MSGKREVAALILVPLATFLFVCLATSLSGVAFRPHCNSARNFVAGLLFQPTAPSTCQSVPFLSDIPTIILSFTSPFALVSYRLLRRRLSWLPGAVTATGLLRPQDPSSDLLRRVRSIESAVDMTAIRRWALFLACGVMTTWLYWRNLVDGHLFDTLATVDASRHSNVETLRQSWWANYHHHPVLAFICVFIGTVGVTYALRAGWLYLRLGAFLYSTRKVDVDEFPLDYVPRWKDQSYGWSPVTGALTLIYFSTVNFAISMVSVFDMLRNETWTIYVATFFAILGVVSNLAIILTSFIRMLAAHQAVEERLRGRLEAMADGDQGRGTDRRFLVAAIDLVSWRRIPVSSVTIALIKIVPGLYGLFQFIQTYSGNRP